MNWRANCRKRYGNLKIKEEERARDDSQETGHYKKVLRQEKSPSGRQKNRRETFYEMKHLILPAWLTILSGILPIILTACLQTPEECPFAGTADEAVLKQYVYFITLVIEKTRVSPSAASTPIPDTTLEGPFTFTSQDKLELVFMTKDIAINGSICINEAKSGGKIIFNQDWSFSNQTGIGWSNLMRPPEVTVRENRIPLGAFKKGPYAIHIAIENTLVKSISFTVK